MFFQHCAAHNPNEESKADPQGGATGKSFYQPGSIKRIEGDPTPSPHISAVLLVMSTHSLFCNGFIMRWMMIQWCNKPRQFSNQPEN